MSLVAFFPSVSLRAWPSWPSSYWSIVNMPAQVFSEKFRHSQGRYLVIWCKFHVISMNLDFVIFFNKHPGIDVTLYFSITYPCFWQARVRPVRFVLCKVGRGCIMQKRGQIRVLITLNQSHFCSRVFYYSFLCTMFAGSICKCSRFVVMSDMEVIAALGS